MNIKIRLTNQIKIIRKNLVVVITIIEQIHAFVSRCISIAKNVIS